MIRILSDTSTMYSTTQAREAGFDVSALSVTINGKSYREFDEISADEFVEIINQGHMPTSSQPAIGEVTELYEKYPEDQLLNIAMADGLSGTYQSAVTAAQMAERENITVINTRTLCGPHRYMVEKAVQWVKEGLDLEEILRRLNERMDSAKSFLLPADFDYLRRGGRLSPLVSYVGKAVSLTPVMTQTEDGRRLTVAGIRRGYAHGIQFVAKALEKLGVGEGWRIYISHAAVPEKAQQALEILKTYFPDSVFEIYPLSPAFITQGGPGCVAVQIVTE